MMSGDNMRMASAMAVVAGRAARPCDGCGFKKARWYCAADEAYLCDACDGSVHAANALSLRHERVRLGPNGAPLKMERRNIVHPSGEPPRVLSGAPSKKKVKSRHGSHHGSHQQQQQQQQYHHHHHQRKLPMPEVKLEFGNSGGNDVDTLDDHFTAEELTGRSNLYDDFDPDFAREFLVCDPHDISPNHHRNSLHRRHGRAVPSESREDVGDGEGEDFGDGMQDGYGGKSKWMQFEDSDYGLDFGVPRGSFAADDTDNIGAGATEAMVDSNGVKMEEGGVHNMHQQNFKMDGVKDRDVRQVPSLRLDYADVMSSWPDRGMMWTQAKGTGESNSDVMGTGYDLGLVPDLGGSRGALSMGAGGSGSLGEESPGLGFGNEREARVIRYREKRRNRLFSKKIRYEVRKLNAERRPRMKGRFVKRSPGRD